MNTTTAPTNDELSSIESAARRPKRLRKVLAAGLGLAALASATAAYAVPSFNDVPESHPFVDEIEWMADTGISTGYPDGGFHPDEPVTRQAMAAFMQRLYNLQDTTYVGVNSSQRETSSAAWTQPAGLTVTNIEVPEGTRGWLHATFNAESSCYGGSSYCKVRLVYRTVGSGDNWEMLPTVGSEFAFDSTNGGTEQSNSWEGHSVTRSTLAPLLPGLYEVSVQIAVNSADGTEFRVDDTHLRVDVDLAQTDI
jgi:hypothetical protein